MKVQLAHQVLNQAHLTVLLILFISLECYYDWDSSGNSWYSTSDGTYNWYSSGSVTAWWGTDATYGGSYWYDSDGEASYTTTDGYYAYYYEDGDILYKLSGATEYFYYYATSGTWYVWSGSSYSSVTLSTAMLEIWEECEEYYEAIEAI